MEKEKRWVEHQYELLLKEIDYLRKRLDTFDDLSFKLKGWGITIWSAMIGYGVTEKTYLLIVCSIPAMLTFFFVEGVFKKYQRRYLARLRVIELFTDSEVPFEGVGLKESLENDSFGQFPTNDPVLRRSMKKFPLVKEKFESYTSFRIALFVNNIYPLYLFLIVISSIIAAIIKF